MSVLDGVPRHRFTDRPTALQPLDRLSDWLGAGVRVWIKRDDRTNLALGGNKARKLEFLVADALARGCDALITCGSVQSNHCRLTAAAANAAGLEGHLVLREKKPGQYDPNASGNNLIYRLLGAHVHPHPPGTDLDAAMTALAEELKGRGKTAYVIPMGGSNPVGALGYVASALEIRDQATELGFEPTAVIHASSSGGTQAGLTVGMGSIPVIGVSVDEPEDRLIGMVSEIAQGAADRLGLPIEQPITVDPGYIGPGYAEPTESMVEAVRALARLEGVITDPVYTGKGAAGLIGRIRLGHHRGDVVFVHTGGQPALFAYPHPAVPSE